MLSGLPGSHKNISEVNAFGPVSQNLRILFALYSLTRTNEPFLLTATPVAIARLRSNNVLTFVVGLYLNRLPEKISRLLSRYWRSLQNLGYNFNWPRLERTFATLNISGVNSLLSIQKEMSSHRKCSM